MSKFEKQCILWFCVQYIIWNGYGEGWDSSYSEKIYNPGDKPMHCANNYKENVMSALEVRRTEHCQLGTYERSGSLQRRWRRGHFRLKEQWGHIFRNSRQPVWLEKRLWSADNDETKVAHGRSWMYEKLLDHRKFLEIFKQLWQSHVSRNIILTICSLN